MIIPHTGEGSKSIKIPLKLIRVFSVMLILGLLFTYDWMYKYTYIKVQNEELQITQEQNVKVINDYSKDYLAIYQDLKILTEKMVEVEKLEAQVRLQNGFDPTKSYFSKANQQALSKESKTVASTIDTDEAKDQLDILKEAIPEKEKSLKELVSLMEERNEVLLSIPSIYPTVGRVTSRFGYREDPYTGSLSFHDGYDIANGYGTKIYATADGIVTFSGRQSGYGNEVIINHGNGFETVYAHNSKNLVTEGDFVRKGEIIAYMGSTGRSTGPHVHYEVRKYGQKVNPANYLN